MRIRPTGICVLAGSLMLWGGASAARADSEEGQNLDRENKLLENIEIHGFGSLGFLNSSENNYLMESRGGSFEFNELALNAIFNLRDDLRVGVQVLVGAMGEYGNCEPRLDWGYVDWTVDGLRTGVSMTPLSLDVVLAISPFMQMMGLPPTTDVTMRMKKWVLSGEYRTGSFLLAGEYSWGTGGIDSMFFSSESADEQYYVMGTYRITHLFEVGSYYSANFEDSNDKEGQSFDPFYAAFQKDLAVTMRVDPVRYLIFKLEYHRVDGTGQVSRALNPAGTEKNWSYSASKVTFAF